MNRQSPSNKSYLGELDEKSAAFVKEIPTDPPRWQLKLFALKLRGMRSMQGMEPVSEAGLTLGLSEILEAPDANAATKGFAGFLQVMALRGDASAFQNLAEAHKKAYPDLKENRQIDSQLKTAETEKTLRKALGTHIHFHRIKSVRKSTPTLPLAAPSTHAAPWKRPAEWWKNDPQDRSCWDFCFCRSSGRSPDGASIANIPRRGTNGPSPASGQSPGAGFWQGASRPG